MVVYIYLVFTCIKNECKFTCIKKSAHSARRVPVQHASLILGRIPKEFWKIDGAGSRAAVLMHSS